MVANRGYDSVNAKTRIKLIEAAYELLAEEGYPAISARRIAGRADLKPQLVHYYFRSMEELVVTIFQKSSASYFRLHDEALSSPRPLHTLWELNCTIPEAQRMMEYVALARQYPGLRDEMRRSGESFRALQVAAITRIYAERGITEPQLTPATLAMLMSAVARAMIVENQVRMTSAHDEMRAFVEGFLDELEP